jgi:hypothetical protein
MFSPTSSVVAFISSTDELDSSALPANISTWLAISRCDAVISFT